MSPPSDKPAFRAALLAWYDAHRRDLPWRANAADRIDPYAVWVSEVMLQQTRVDAVKPYFARWMQRFPTVGALAAAPIGDVLKAWEGLGYYSRARNLHRAATRVAERHGGTVPDDPAAFRELPGVGRYTAGAVMSIAFDRPEPVVDGNVRRVFARILNAAVPSEADLWSLAEGLAPGPRPGDLNQSVMELGAMVCTPRSPRCGACPVRGWCAAAAAGTQDERPLPRRRGPIPHEPTAVAIVERDGRVLLARRSVDGRLGGMWEFPATVHRPRESAARAAERALREGVGLDATATTRIGTVEHAFTHVRVTYHASLCTARTGEPQPILYDACAWAAQDDLHIYPMPVAQKRIAALFNAR